MVQQAADAGADLEDFLGGVNGAVVHIERVGHAAFVKRRAERFDERVHIFRREELTVTTDPRRIIKEGDEPGLHGHPVDFHKRAVKRVRLPIFVGVGFGERQADFLAGLRVWLEQLKLPHQPVEGVGRNLGTGYKSGFDAQPVEQRPRRRFTVDFGQHLLHGLQHVFDHHLAPLALVGTRLVFHDGHAMFLITRIPGLDRAPGELARVAILIGKGHLADGPDAGLNRIAFSHVNGPKHPHFQIGSGISHESLFFAVVCIHVGDATGHGMPRGMGLSCCRRPAKPRRQNPDMIIRQRSEAVTSVLSQKRTLKPELKGRWWALAVRKDCPQMLHGLQQGIGVRAGWGWLLPAKPAAKLIQPVPQTAAHPIDRFQRKGQPQLFRRRLEGKSGQ